jgi:serine/threonine protein kinase
MVGRGGSAAVWAAEDEALGRRVALKLVTSTGGDDAGRVGDEARLLARLNHPGLVPVYDAGTDDSGRPWVVMELVVGETLADAVRRGPLGSERVAEIGRVLAEALGYVHGEGLVHRDVKPANVLLGRDGRVRLTDFGIARLVDAAKVTATGLTVGTASYLSPEQVLGAHVGPLADVYSLGLVLLECLTGRREYPGTAVEVALARLSRQPVVPATLPGGWPGLLAAMTAREPGPRPTAHEVARELATIAAGGEATTVLGAGRADAGEARTQALDRTQVLGRTAAVPLPVAEPARPLPRPAPGPAPLPAPRSSGWFWALLLVGLVALAVVGFLVYDSRANDPGQAPPAVSPTLPDQLRRDLEQLQREVAS